MNLPKPYMSWSQLSAWETSHAKYADTYFRNKPFYATKEMAFGKEFARVCETSDILSCGEELSKAVIETQKHLLADRERELVNYLGRIPLLSFIDSSSPGLTEIVEVKTGKKEWNQARVDSHFQLDFYALQSKLETGKLPKIKLVWIETRDGEEGIEPTGRVEVFEREITDTEKLEERIKKAVEEISEAYTAFQNESENNIDREKLKEYAALTRVIESAKEEKDKLGIEIASDFERNSIPSLKIENLGNFFFTTRKKYKFTEDFEKKIATAKVKVKKIEEEGKATAEISETKSLSFRNA